MVNSINTNIAAYYAQANISAASAAASKSVARLSSGNRIVDASDDVAGLSIGTSLATSVSTLKIAATNASQGATLLQIADGALAQIGDIVSRQKAIAVQAGSGSLTDTDRGFLDQEFQALQQEIDRLAGSTTFNGVKLVNGSLSSSSSVTDQTSNANAAALNLNFNDDITTGEKVNFISGTTIQTFVAGTDFAIGSNLAGTVSNLATALNNLADNPTYNNTIGKVVFSANGTSLGINARAGGSLGDSFAVDLSGSATVSNEASVSYGSDTTGFGNVSSFNLFSATTGLTSTSTVVSALTAAAGTPFQNGDTISATTNGTTKTLFVLTAGAGTGTGGNYTLQDIVNGINSNASVTDISASLVYSAGTYNIRLNYSGTASNVLFSGGANYDGATYDLNGQGIDTTTANLAVAAGATKHQALFYTKYVDVLATPGLGAAVTTTVTAAASTSVAGTPFTVGDNLTINIDGKNVVLHTFATNDGLDDIAADINTNSVAGGYGVRAVITGTTGAYNLRLYMTDPGAQYSTISAGANFGSGATLNTTSGATGATLTQTVNSSLGGGDDDGLNQGSVSATGSSGNNIITDLAQAHANVSVLLTQNASVGDTVTVGGHAFTFTNNTSGAPDEILIGSSLQATLDNAVSTLTSYLANGDALGTTGFEMNQLNITRSGNSLVFTSKGLGNVSTLAGGNASIAQSVTGASITNSGNLTNSSATYGVNTTGITNAAFQGTIGGFTATYKNSPDTVDLSVKIGNYTYTAKDVDTTVSANTRIRFYSDQPGGAGAPTGGYFDIQLQANQVATFSDQAGADGIADRLNAAFSSLTFLQNHNISSYKGTQSISVNNNVIGSLIGSNVSAQLSDFSNLRLSNVQVSAPSGSNTDAKISLLINGVTYSTAPGLTDQLGANQTYRLVSENDSNQYVDFTTGSSGIDLSSSANALAVQTALKSAFGASSGSAALSFQVGATAADTLNVSIGDATTANLYQGQTLDVLTQQDAANASATLDTALETLTSLRANVGALQSRFNFASASIQSSEQNEDAARSSLLDTDIASESTAYATSQVKIQAGISVLAQANQQLQALLKLIG